MSINTDIRTLAKWLNEELTSPIDRPALARVLAHLQQPAQQEPVAWMYQCSADSSGPVLTQSKKDWAASGSGLWTEAPLYTRPQAREWVGLTEQEANELWESTDSDWELMKRTEAKLREKNA